MSVIALVFQRDGHPADSELVHRMLQVTRHRGPDRQTVFPSGAAALGYGQLTTTPEEIDTEQPRLSRRSGCVLVADARLDNRPAILTQLGADGDPGLDDAEFILRLYEARGIDFAADLEGDFAVVIWDPRARRIVATRDERAQRPLYYFLAPDRFLAASSIVQLLEDPRIVVEPDEERIRDHLVPFNVERNAYDQHRTFLAGIWNLPAGHTLVVDEASVKLSPFRTPPKPAVLRYRHAEDYVEHFRFLLYEAVRAQLRSAGPVGALLSGGLDSTSVVAAAQELYRQDLVGDRGFVAYTGIFGGPENDEREYTGALQAKYGFSHRTVDARQAAVTLCLEPTGFVPTPGKVVNEVDPLLDAATADGVRVVLTGEVADACVFGAPQVFDSLLRAGRLVELTRRLRTYHARMDESWTKVLAVYCLAPLLPLSLQRRWLPIVGRRAFERSRKWLIPPWIADDVRSDLEERQLARTLVTEAERRFGNPARHWEDSMLRPPEVGYEPRDWPLEFRRPYANTRLIEYLLAVPPEEKFGEVGLSDSWYAGSKQLVRRAFQDVLPESIRTRTTKPHFASVFHSELQKRWDDYTQAFGPGARSEIASRGYVQPLAFWERLGRVRDGSIGPDFLLILRLVTLESWLRAVRGVSRQPALNVSSSWSAPRPP